MSKERGVIIIGNGISGITAARYIRKKSNRRIRIISDESPHFFSRTALMYVYMGHMKFGHIKPYEDFFWDQNNLELISDRVEAVDFNSRSLQMRNGEKLHYDDLILATGSKPNIFDWKGIELNGVQGLYSKQDLELLEKNTHSFKTSESAQRVKKAVIVGGGLIGVELAEMLMTRNIDVTFLIRESRYWGNVLPEEESKLVMKHMLSHGVEIMTEEELEGIIGDDENNVHAIRTKKGKEIECQFVGLTAGVSPNIDFLKSSQLDTNRGILVDGNLRTNQSNVYAIGDCAEHRNPPEGRSPVEQVWYSGRMMGMVAANNILGNDEQYDPGPWFNSAKFFDIEYQTYGWVRSQKQEGEKSFYWESDAGDQCVRIVTLNDGTFAGINAFGIRIRHELMDKWLRERRSTEFVLSKWNDALFDPEFYRNVGRTIIDKYNLENNVQLNIEPKNLKNIFT